MKVIEAIVVAVFICVLVAMLASLPVFHARRPAEASPPSSWTLYTVEHDGHWWVLGNRVGFHHPDCPCGKRTSK
jgi:hypothetical protein